MSVLTEVIEQMQEDFKNLKARVDKIEPREIDAASKKNILDQLDVVTDDGTAEPSVGVLDVLGGDSIDTAGAGNDVTINVTDDSIGLDKLAVGNVCTTDRRFHLDFDGHGWPDLMEPGWEPTDTNVIFLGWEHMAKGVAKYGKAAQIASAVTVMNVNPSFETNTNSWAAVGGGIARTTDEYRFGDYSCSVTPTAGVNDGINQTANIAIAAATDYTVHIWVKHLSAGIPMQLRVVTDVGGNHDQTYTSQEAPLLDGWQFIPITFTSDALDTNIIDIFIQKNNSADTTVFYVDMLNVTATSYPTPSCDGSLGTGMVWTGAAHASTSTRAAATLTYPNDVVAYPSGDCYEQLTIAGWFIPAWASDDPGPGTYAWDIRGANNNHRIMIQYDVATDTWQLYINGGFRCASAAQSFGNWEPQFIVVTFDFDANSYNFYINDDAVVNSTAALTPPAFGVNAFYLATKFDGTLAFDCLIDDFVIYPRVLSADEISAIYKFGNPLLPPTHANMRIIPGEWTSATFAGGGFSTTAWTTLDLVNDFGIPFGAKAVSVFTLIRDSGAAGKVLQLRKDATHSPSLHAWTQVGGNMWVNTNGMIPVANGRTIDYDIGASGALTFDIYMRIYAVYL